MISENVEKNDEIELGIEVFHTPKCGKKAETLDLMPHLKLTQIVNRAFTHRVDRAFTHQVNRVFTLRVNRAFTCPLNGYRQETTMILRAKRGFITRLFTKAKLFDEKNEEIRGLWKSKCKETAHFTNLLSNTESSSWSGSGRHHRTGEAKLLQWQS